MPTRVVKVVAVRETADDLERDTLFALDSDGAVWIRFANYLAEWEKVSPPAGTVLDLFCVDLALGLLTASGKIYTLRIVRDETLWDPIEGPDFGDGH